MVSSLEGVQISSASAKDLANFYQDKVGIKIKEEYEMGESQSAFEMDAGGGSSFMILDHDDISGKASEPMRIMINFEVPDIDKAIADAKANDVKVVQDKFHIEGYGYLAMFEDLDGNHFQLAQIRENN